jgi:hypothetical protein
MTDYPHMVQKLVAAHSDPDLIRDILHEMLIRTKRDAKKYVGKFIEDSFEATFVGGNSWDFGDPFPAAKSLGRSPDNQYEVLITFHLPVMERDIERLQFALTTMANHHPGYG